MNKNSLKKYFSIKNIIFYIFIILIAYILISAASAKANHKPVYLFGVSINLVVTDSMEPEIMTGDLVICNNCDITEIKIGEDIMFLSKDTGLLTIHRVDTIEQINGKTYISTYGINTESTAGAHDSPRGVSETNFFGKMVFKSTFLGAVFGFFTKWYNLLILGVLIFLSYYIIKQVKKIKNEVKAAKENLKEQIETESLPDNSKPLSAQNEFDTKKDE